MSPTATKAPVAPEVLSALSRLRNDKARRAFLRKHKLLSPDVIVELNAATSQELRVNTENALSLAEGAVAAARCIRKSNLLAQSYRIKANVHLASEEYEAAVREYDSALKLFEKVKDQEGIARTLTAAIQPHIMLGAYDRAFELAERAQNILRDLNDQRRLARLENNIGNIYHRQDRVETALAHYERAYAQLLPFGDIEELTISLNNISMCLISMNGFAQALATYERATKLLDTRDLPLVRLTVDYNIAYLYHLRGDYRRAVEILKSALAAGKKIGHSYLTALCHLDLSDIFVELNLSAEAQESAEQGHMLFRGLNIGYEAAKSLSNQAIALGQAGKTGRALELFAQAKPLFVKEKNEVWPRLIELYEAVVLFHAGQYKEAGCLARSAATFFDASFLKNKAAVCHMLLAQVAIKIGDFVEAQDECLRALDILEGLDVPILAFQAYFLRGQIEQARGDLRAARAEYQRARTELESLRTNLVRDELKISFMKNRTEVYERLVELCISPDLPEASPEEAFQYIELAKSRSLAELIEQRSHSHPEPKLGQSEKLQKIHDLHEELTWYQHRIELEQLQPQKNAAEKIEKLRTEARVREKALLSEFAEMPDSEADIAALRSHRNISLEEVQSLLPDDTAFLEYYFAGDRVLVAVVKKNALTIVPVTTVSRVAKALRLLRFQLGRVESAPQFAQGSSSNMYQSALSHLKELFAELIAPVRSQLTERHIVVVPHGALHYLPFHALHDGENFLIDSHTISYAPSAGIYALCHRHHEGPGGGSLVLGIPDAHAPLIRDEAEAVHQALPNSELFLGADANHELLLRKASSSRLIHIATHGRFRPDNPMFSGIRLGDGYLYLYELYQMRLSADLLTLSGCATGLNVIGAGDELLGLIRGALSAGARSLLLTLWDVNDRSTARFMTSFYRRLQQSANKAEALANAAKEVREEFPHPYYWAPFVIVGKALSGPLSLIAPEN